MRGSLRWVGTRVFAPGVFVAAIGVAMVLSLQGAAPAWLGVLLAAALAACFAAERMWPYEPVWNRDRGDGDRDLLHALVNEGATVASIALLPVLASFAGTGLWPEHWPLLAQWALAVVVADMGITLAHAASHRYAALWRLHAVHHSVTRMYGMNGWMKHPLHQGLETLAGTAPLIVLGLPQTVAWLLGFSVALQLLLQHANLEMRLGALGRWWAVAPGHRLHHVASTDGDVNFGLFTLVWDRMLGTYRAPEEAAPRDGALGVADRSDYPVAYLAQLVEPFRLARRWRPAPQTR
ncbi:MAG: sterol desaturase family protein [Myxococcota bacterium]